MSDYATAQVYLPTVAENMLFMNPIKTKNSNTNGLAATVLDDNIPAMNIDDYNLAGDATMGSALVTEPYAPAFTTFGCGQHKAHGSSSKLWTCCRCGDSAMSIKGTPCCANYDCQHRRCSDCITYSGTKHH